MDDIAGLNRSSTTANGQNPAPSTSNYSAFATLKPTPPASGRASPFNAPSSQPPSKPSTPANDSFANLVSFGPASNKNLSLLEQQKRQTEARLQQQRTHSQRLNDQYAGGDDQFWNTLGSGPGTPAIETTKKQTTNTRHNGLDDDDDDLFSAFNKPTAAKSASARAPAQRSTANHEDDDLFGLSEARPRRADTEATTTTLDSDDDVLGLLGKPASSRTRQASPPHEIRDEATHLRPQDKAVAELVDMGFPADKANFALEATGSGVDVQAAVGILLNQAHAEARQKSQPKSTARQGADEWAEAQPAKSRARSENEDGLRARAKAKSPAPEKDFEKMAADLGSNFLKSANSFWKQGTKRVQQAVQEFNSDNEGGGSQPKWMRESAEPPTWREQPRRQEAQPVPDRTRRSQEVQSPPDMTDEAMMLEGGRPTPPPRPASSLQRPGRRFEDGADSSRDHSPAVPSRLRESLPQIQPAFLRQQNQSPAMGSKPTLSRAAAEEQAAQAYVSSARRRKPQAQPSPSAPSPSQESSDLLENGFKGSDPRPTAPSITSRPSSSRSQPQPVSRSISTPPIDVRPPPPTRSVPAVSPIALKASHNAREKGNDHFKRGDYASAHQSYSTSLSYLPEAHPLTIILLTNRALTALKTGEPKTATVDADKAILLIGPSKGESETVTTGEGVVKPMREYFGKALMRKAEALEQMERWPDAANVWREAVEGGHGGATSIQGRIRAEKAANPQKPKPAVAAPRRPATAPPASTRRRPPSAQQPAEAVSRLRAANAQADAVDDEKFRLSDQIDARIIAWKGGKQDNLRALLGSLENVLWEGSGWKKVSLADLVLPGKVKVNYMKGIARVHPDKVCFCRAHKSFCPQ